MAHIAPNAVRETSTTTGTGNLTLAGAVSGFRSFSGAGALNNDTFFYRVEHRTAAEYEEGLGTYVAATPALARTTILGSSNSGAVVNFSAGTKDVRIVSLGLSAGWGSLTVTPSGTQDDYSPSGLGLTNELVINSSASIGIKSLAGGVLGREIIIRNGTTDYLVWLENESGTTAANRFKLPRGFPAFLLPDDSIKLRYNGIRWVVVGWPNQGQAMGLTVFCDFEGGRRGPFEEVFSGSGAAGGGTAGGINTTERPMGVEAYQTGTTSSGRAGLGSANPGSIVPTLAPALSVARFAVSAATDGTQTFSVVAGFHDANNTGTWNDGVAWEYRWTGSAAEMSQTRAAGGSLTRSNTNSPAAPPANTYIWAVVFLNASWTRADFIYSNDSVSFIRADSPTTGLPNSSQATNWGIAILKSAGTTSRLLYVDLLGVRYDLTRG